MVQAEFGDRLLIAHHHEDDVFEIPWVVERSDLYGAGCIPHVRIDGKFAIRGASSCSWAAAEYRAAIQRRLVETGGLAPIEVEGVYLVEADSVRVGARFTLVDPADLGQARAYLLLLVDGLVWQGVTYDQVTQAAWDGPLTLAQPGDEATVEAVFPRAAGWEADEIRCVAFAQRMTDSLEVHQATWLNRVTNHAPEGTLSCATGRLRLHPNPLPASSARLVLSGMPEASLAGAPPAALALVDAQGRRVRGLRIESSTAIGWSLGWDGRDEHGRPLPAGTYWVRLAGDGPRARLTFLR